MKKLSTKRRQEYTAALILLLPALIYLCVFVIGPIIYAFVLSFQDRNLLSVDKGEFVGLKNYIELLDDKSFTRGLLNTTIYALVTVPVQIVFALLLASLANRKVRFPGFYRVSYYLPAVTSSVAITTIFMFLFSKRGAVNSFLSIFGLDLGSWFASTTLALPLIMIIAIWSSIPTQMVILLAGMQDISPDLYEVSNVDGATPTQQFFKITLPLLRPKLFFVLLVGFIGAFQVFDSSYIISKGNGGPQNATMTVVLYIYRTAFAKDQIGRACAGAFILFAIIFTLTLIQKKFFKGEAD